MKLLKRKSPREPAQHLGLTFYPILVSDYETFLHCKSVLALRMSTLPVRYMIMDYTSALFSMEMDAVKDRKAPVGMFDAFLALLSLSLRIDYDGRSFLEENVDIEVIDGEIHLKAITVEQNGNRVTLTPSQLSGTVRSLIAEQNGVKLPDESENTELIEGEKEKEVLMSQNKMKLDVNMDDLIASVAYLSRTTEDEVLKWSVKELEGRKRAIEREKRYMIYGQTEMTGLVKFKSGNPYPSLFFDVLDDSAGTVEVSKLNLPGQNSF